jgi:DNA-binding PadR family transcriptional regulator
MDIQFAILGLLSWQPWSGYDLKKMISDSDLFYWSGANNQIYHSLVQLHQEELVTQYVQVQEQLPAKKIYSITEKGRAALRQALSVEPELPDFRNAFLIQLAWTEPLSDEELDALLGRYEAEMEVQLKMRQMQARRPAISPARSERERFVWSKIDENLVAVYQHELDWVRDLRGGLKSRLNTET